MKRILILVTCCFFYAQSGAQNLVSNPSLEIYSACPLSAGQIYLATNWFQPNSVLGNVNSASSSDYYNQCAPYGNTSVPVNDYSGHQVPRTGNGYAGIQVYDGEIISQYQTREYLETSLISPLVQGKKYCVEFYVSLADSSMYAISNLGIVFSNDSFIYISPTYQFISIVPQVENAFDSIVIDKENWVLVSGSFIAAGGERFMTIGNFDSDSMTNSQFAAFSVYTGSYYYFDDFSVYDCDSIIISTEGNVFVPNAFSPNNDGQNDVLYVRGQNIASLHFEVYDRWGKRVFETSDKNVGWDGTYSGEKLENAVFVYTLSLTYGDGATTSLHGNISLIK